MNLLIKKSFQLLLLSLFLPIPVRAFSWSLLFKKQLPGVPLNMEIHSESILLALSPDPTLKQSSKNAVVMLMNFKGEIQWQEIQKFPIKSLTLSSSRYFSLSNFNNQIKTFDLYGKFLWETKGFCNLLWTKSLSTPLLVGFQEDEALQGVAFQLWNPKGEKLKEEKASSHALFLKKAPDDSSFGILFHQGPFLITQLPNLESWISESSEKPWLDLALTPLPQQKLAALKQDKTLSLFKRKDSGFEKMGEILLPKLPDQILWSPLGDQLLVYFSESNQGKILSYQIDSVLISSTPQWEFQLPGLKTKSVPIQVTTQGLWIPFENPVCPGIHKQQGFAFLNFLGKGYEFFPIPMALESVLTHLKVIQKKHLQVVAASDDGWVRVFEETNLSKVPCQTI